MRVIVGSKNTKKKKTAARNVPTVEAVNALSMIRQLDKVYSGFAGEYDYLCEIAHPNQMGALVPFGEIAPGLDVELSQKPTYGDQFCSTLCMALAVFEHHYNRIADVFPAFLELCRRDAPRTLKEREKAEVRKAK